MEGDGNLEREQRAFLSLSATLYFVTRDTFYYILFREKHFHFVKFTSF